MYPDPKPFVIMVLATKVMYSQRNDMRRAEWDVVGFNGGYFFVTIKNLYHQTTETAQLKLP
jgi:hypothetical protein